MIMKMKAKYIYQIGAFLLGSLIMSGCVQWPEFEALDLESAPTVTVEQTNVGDSTITVAVTSSTAGFMSAILLEGSGNAVPADSGALLQGNVEYLDFASGEVEANTPASVTFSTDLIQNMDYQVMAVAANPDGVVSSVAVADVTTTDSYPPALTGSTPGFTYDPVILLNDTIMLSFDEPVQLGTGSFTFETFYGGATISVPADSVSASGNMVTILMPMMPDYGDYLWLHWEADAVTDYAGNGVGALTTILDGGSFVGAYWRLVQVPMDYTAVAPDVATAQAPGFDIVLTYGDAVDIGDLADGDIQIEYFDAAGVLLTTEYVPVADVAAAGADLTISQTQFVPADGSITLVIPDGAFAIGYGNPVAAAEISWDVQ